MTDLAMELYDAPGGGSLPEAGASEEKARAAARSAASPDAAAQALRADLQEIRADARHSGQEIPALRNAVQGIVADIAVIKWQIGAIIGILLLLGVPGIWLILKIGLKLNILSL